MTAFKNHSMLREARLTKKEKIIKETETLERVEVDWHRKVFPPIGHIYSLLVEELKIEKPNFNKFLEEFNDYLVSGALPEIDEPHKPLSDMAAIDLCIYIKANFSLTEDQFEKIKAETYNYYYENNRQ
jgi:hypothetical protein